MKKFFCVFTKTSFLSSYSLTFSITPIFLIYSKQLSISMAFSYFEFKGHFEPIFGQNVKKLIKNGLKMTFKLNVTKSHRNRKLLGIDFSLIWVRYQAYWRYSGQGFF